MECEFLGEECIKRVLNSSGMTNREAEVYIFLAKHNAIKGTEVARLMKMDKAHVFHILKRLQSKGYVETTLEFPTRYTVIPLKNVLEAIVKNRQDEVAYIEEAKNDLLSFIEKQKVEPLLDKFVVIRGNKRIRAKILQLIRNSKNHLSAAITVQGFMYKFGIIESIQNHPLKEQIQFRFITESKELNEDFVKNALKKIIKTEFQLKVIDPESGLRMFPRMVTRDYEETLFFTSPSYTESEKEEVCLWTNCMYLVQAFTNVFEDLWRNSTDIHGRIEPNMEDSSRPTSHIKLQSVLHNSSKTNSNTSSTNNHFIKDHFRKMSGMRFEEKKTDELKEKDVLEKIFAGKTPEEKNGNFLLKGYGSVASAIIHSDFLNLPEMVIQVYHMENQSSIGEENFLVISLPAQLGQKYIPSAIISDNSKAYVLHKALMKGTPAEKNIEIINKDSLRIMIHGNSLFAGWNVPIHLNNRPFKIPPSCILFDGYGEVKSHKYTAFYPSGFKIDIERNGLDAFVTFFHPKTKHNGSGIDGFIARDFVATINSLIDKNKD